MFESQTKKRLKILDFDIEARPLSWIGGDFVSREVTAIAARFVHQRHTHVWLLGEDEPVDMLEGFRALYDEADQVTGHFIRGFDLPNLNAAMLDHGLDPLGSKWSIDTKQDLLRLQGVSKSQESLASILETFAPKVKMTQSDWRDANRLTPEGLAKTRKRVVGDVRQHIEMLKELQARGWVGPGKVWSPGPGNAPRYAP